MTLNNTCIYQVFIDSSSSKRFVPVIISFVIISSELNIDIESTINSVSTVIELIWLCGVMNLHERYIIRSTLSR